MSELSVDLEERVLRELDVLREALEHRYPGGFALFVSNGKYLARHSSLPTSVRIDWRTTGAWSNSKGVTLQIGIESFAPHFNQARAGTIRPMTPTRFFRSRKTGMVMFGEILSTEANEVVAVVGLAPI
jgi:hypothetical protein